jgi:flagellar biogenesis protein FliO
VADFDLAFLLIPLLPALAFMLWVIWGLEKQIREDRRHRDAIPRPRG